MRLFDEIRFLDANVALFQLFAVDSVCIEALSVNINDRALEQATRSLGRLSSEVSRLKATDSQRLQNEYQNLVNGLIDQGLLDSPANDSTLVSVRCGLDRIIVQLILTQCMS
jgi:hypothetical protein